MIEEGVSSVGEMGKRVWWEEKLTHKHIVKLI